MDLALNNLQNQTKPNPVYLMCMCKEDLALNNQQRLICDKTRLNQIIYIYDIKRIWHRITYNVIKPNQTKPNIETCV